MKGRIIVMVITFIIALTLFGFWLYTMITYGYTPLSEVPLWAY